jgi:hypothetical protein
VNGKNLKYFVLGAAIVAAGLGALAVTIPNSFSSGQVISAAALNANFAALKTAVDTLETKTTTLETKVAALETFRDGLATAKGYPRAFAVINGFPATNAIVNQFSSTGGTITYSKTAVGRYRLTIPGEAIFIQSDPVVMTGVGDTVCGYNSVSNDLLVECRNQAGTDVDTVVVVMVFND